ncbi:MAG TPA: hypothetical protein VH395_08915 [Jatrophihabitantaceae bacterium]|jgi:hypothetical protein
MSLVDELRATLQPLASENVYARLYLLRLAIAADPDREARVVLDELVATARKLRPVIDQIRPVIEAWINGGLDELEREANR